jgi:hypothetical protein
VVVSKVDPTAEEREEGRRREEQEGDVYALTMLQRRRHHRSTCSEGFLAETDGRDEEWNVLMRLKIFFSVLLFSCFVKTIHLLLYLSLITQFPGDYTVPRWRTKPFTAKPIQSNDVSMFSFQESTQFHDGDLNHLMPSQANPTALNFLLTWMNPLNSFLARYRSCIDRCEPAVQGTSIHSELLQYSFFREKYVVPGFY